MNVSINARNESNQNEDIHSLMLVSSSDSSLHFEMYDTTRSAFSSRSSKLLFMTASSLILLWMNGDENIHFRFDYVFHQ